MVPRQPACVMQEVASPLHRDESGSGGKGAGGSTRGVGGACRTPRLSFSCKRKSGKAEMAQGMPSSETPGCEAGSRLSVPYPT